ncbi:MAG: hypothetical protein HY647_12680 [Acidobacteria bacterium]|nr:hypothetical protein [Acidobacteriota bacterium]
MAHPQIAAFARLAQENTNPNRLIAGQKTLLSRTMHDIRYDAVHDEFLVTNPFARAILVFRGGADGEEAPIRIIQGPKTQLGGVDRAEVDPVHNEIYVADDEAIRVYSREANGDVAPIRVIAGPDTQLDAAGTVAVDPVNNVIVAARDSVPRGSRERSKLLIFDRAANGNAKPLRVIAGPKTEIIRINQLQIHSPKGWIVATQPGFVDMQEPEGIFIGIWSIHDNGDVPPRWKIGGTPKGVMVKPRGVAIDPAHKELIVADMRLNSVLTYYFPEMF